MQKLQKKNERERIALQITDPALGQQMGLWFLNKCTGGSYGRWNFGVLASALVGWHAVTHPDVYKSIIPKKNANYDELQSCWSLRVDTLIQTLLESTFVSLQIYEFPREKLFP